MSRSRHGAPVRDTQNLAFRSKRRLLELAVRAWTRAGCLHCLRCSGHSLGAIEPVGHRSCHRDCGAGSARSRVAPLAGRCRTNVVTLRRWPRDRFELIWSLVSRLSRPRGPRLLVACRRGRAFGGCVRRYFGEPGDEVSRGAAMVPGAWERGVEWADDAFGSLRSGC
jgi:hypothetical protein